MNHKPSAMLLVGAAALCVIITGAVFAGQGQVKREIWFTSADVDETQMQPAIDWIKTHDVDSVDSLTKIDFNGFHDDGAYDPPAGVSDYVARVTGWIVPQVSGTYFFRITSDDCSGLWLSHDDSPPTDIRAETRICGVNGWTNYREWGSGSAGKSADIALVGGQAYAFTAIMVEGGGGDHLSVAWASGSAGIIDPTVIEGEFVSDTNPIRASIPTPADGATNVVVDDLELSWAVPWALNDTEYSVYFGTLNTSDPNVHEDNPQIATGLTTPSLVVDDLETDTTYFWRVDCTAVDANGVPVFNQGPLWRFTTVPATPVVFRQPVSALVSSGETVTFDIDVYSAGGAEMTYAWKKVGDAGFASSAEDLVIADAQIEDEGDYYCQITNASGTVTTDTVYLAIKRLIGRWPFDGNITDVVGGIATVMQTANPAVFDAGMAGTQAIKMVSGTVNPVIISTPAWAQAHRSWTISVWENMPSSAPTSPYPYMLASGTDATGIDRFFSWRYTGGLDYEFRFYQGGTILLQLWGYGFAKDQWHLVTVTYDAFTNTGKIYVDGVLQQSSTVNFAGFAPEIYVGNRKNLARPYEGRLDDLRLYNYAIDGYAAARLYVDFNPGAEICVEDPAMDLNNDCRIDLEDLAIFAQEWGLCNRNPAASCP